MPLRTLATHNTDKTLEEIDLWMIQTSEEEVIPDVMHLAREAELEVEPRNVTELLQSHGKT
jgi:anti-sigma-K factor RskA